MMKDAGAARLGVGTIKEISDKPGMVRVEFGHRGGVYNLETTELVHYEGCRKRVDKVALEAEKHHHAKHGKPRRNMEEDHRKQEKQADDFHHKTGPNPLAALGMN